MGDTRELLRSAVRYALTGNKDNISLLQAADNDELAGLYKLSKAQDLAHLVAHALNENGVETDSELRSKFEKQLGLAVYRTTLNDSTLARICDLLEEIGVDFIPLKGSVLRAYYPERWMRTSCDIDVLIHECDIDKCCQAITERLGMKCKSRNSHDVPFYSDDNVHLELHFTLIEDGRAAESARILSAVWEHSSLRSGWSHYYEMSDAMFYYYHLAHAAKHLEVSGSGIRQVLDLYILDRICAKDASARDALLTEGGLYKLCECMRSLSRVWLGDKTADESDLKLEDYLISSGVYGNLENRVSLELDSSGIKGNRIVYVFKRLFLPYETMKYQYPILEKWKILLPFCQVHRWFDRIFRGRLKSARQELVIASRLTETENKSRAELIRSLGLDP